MRDAPPPPRAASVLTAANPAESDPRATIQALEAALAVPNQQIDDPWSCNLVELAAVRRFHPQVVGFVLDEFRRYKRRSPSERVEPYDREALLSVSRAALSTVQAELLLASVKVDRSQDPDFPLRVLLAATQSESDRWACYLLRHGPDVAQSVRRVRMKGLGPSRTRYRGRYFLSTAVYTARRCHMHGLLRELLVLNRPAVVLGAGEWLDRFESVSLLVLARRRLARDASYSANEQQGSLVSRALGLLRRPRRPTRC